MLQCLCVGWIIGLTLMGRSLFELDLSRLHVVLLGFILFIVFYNLRQKTQSITSKTISTIFSCIFGFLLGYGFSNHALDDRLAKVEHENKHIEVIAYVRHLDRKSVV